jgi:hypothetical protein
MEDKIKLLLLSYSLEELLEEFDVTEEAVLTILHNRGTINIYDMFEEEEDVN